MIREKKVGFITIAVLFMAACVALAISLNTRKFFASATQEIFVDASGVTVEKNDATATQGDERKGTLLTAEQNGSEVTIFDKASGAFEAEFRVVTENTHTDEEIALKTYYPHSAVGSLSFVFTDKNNPDNVFSLVIDEKSEEGYIPMARVETKGKAMGTFRKTYWFWKGINESVYNTNARFGGGLSQETKSANGNGLYSFILDSSFGEAMWYKAGYVRNYVVGDTENAIAPIKVGFDPNTMEVYGYSRGEKIIIWNFSEAINDGYDIGFTLGGFEEYEVKFEFTSLNSAAAKVKFYSINGSLSATSDVAAPAIYANLSEYGVAGEEVVINSVRAFDAIDGYKQSIETKLIKPDGTMSTLSEDAFTPSSAGTYTLEFSATDIAGNKGTLIKTVEIYDALPKSSFVFDGTLGNVVAGVGEEIDIPFPTVTNILYKGNVPVKAVVKSGENVVYTKNMDDDIYYAFQVAGEYEIHYTTDFGDDVSFPVTVYADEAKFSSVGKLAAAYYAGDKIVIPAYKAEKNGKEVNCSFVTEYPNGTKFKNAEITADAVGEYKVVYTANIDGATYSRTRSFVVYDKTEQLFTVFGEGKVKGYGGSLYSDSEKGINVSLVQGSKAVYKGEINFTGKTQYDAFLIFKAMTKKVNTYDAQKFTVTLTDIYDDTNYVQITIYNDEDMGNSSDVKAGAFGKGVRGLRGTALYGSDPWGTLIFHSFRMNNGVDVSLSLDYATRCIYANGVLVIDLDDSKYFSDLWNGFTDGRATLSIELTKAMRDTDFIVKKVGDVDLSAERCEDVVAPAIRLDFAGYSEKDLPKAVLNEGYPVFRATAYDDRDGYVDFEVSCYYVANGRKCEIDTDGNYFTPKKAADYYIDYIAKDGAGNVSIKTVAISVADGADYSVTLSATSGSGYTGLETSLPEYTVRGASGKAAVSVTVTLSNGEKETVGEKYLPVSDGTYTFEYVATDYIGRTTTAQYVYTSERNVMPIIAEVVLPKVAVQGEKLFFPETTTYHYGNGSQRTIDTHIKVSYNGQETVVENGYFVPSILDGDAPLTVVYYAEADGNRKEKSYTLQTLKAVDGNGTTNTEKLFYGKGFSVADEDELVFFTKQNGAKLEFTRSMVANAVDFSFAVPNGYEKFVSLAIILADAIDETNAIAFEIVGGASASTIKILGDENAAIYTMGGAFGVNSGVDFTFLYNDFTRKISVGNTDGALNALTSVLFRMDGRRFDGFASGLVNVTLEFRGVRGNAGISILTVGNASLSKGQMKDRSNPYIYVLEENDAKATHGSEIKVSKAVASDALSSVSLVVDVITPSGNTVYSGDGKQDHYLTLTEYGSYLIRYVATDGAGRTSRKQIFVYVPYDEDPVLTVSGDMPKKVKSGDEITIPGATATNGLSGKVDVYIIIINTDNSIKVVSSNGGEVKYTFEKKGTYTVRYYCVDADSNYVIKDYTVTAE